MGGAIGAAVGVVLIFTAGWVQVLVGWDTQCAASIQYLFRFALAPVLWVLQLLGLPMGCMGITIGFLLSMVYLILIGFGMGVVIVVVAHGLRNLVCRQIGPPSGGDTK